MKGSVLARGAHCAALVLACGSCGSEGAVTSVAPGEIVLPLASSGASATGHDLAPGGLGDPCAGHPGACGFGLLASGANHNAAIKGDGTLWTWGLNSDGQLGDGTTTLKTSPAQVFLGQNPLSNVVAVAGGTRHTAALLADGTVWAWGHNADGELGNGTIAPSLVPTPMNLTGVVAIAAGGDFTVAVLSDGTAWAAGDNDNGQLGDNSKTDRQAPVQIQMTGGAPMTGLVGVAAGVNHVVLLRAGGEVWAVGDNTQGQLGIGNQPDQQQAVQVPIAGAISVAAGGVHSLALLSGGTVWAWGDNAYGQLGDNTTITQTSPVQVGLTGAASVQGGGLHSLAVKTDGTAWAWGDNGNGRLGDGTNVVRLTPVQISGLSGVAALGGGQFHSTALTSDGTVWGFGYNASGQLGLGTQFGLHYTPLPAIGLTLATACGGVPMCDGSVCVAANAFACPPPADCHDPGMCDPTTGLCSSPPSADGTACDDGSACTLSDTCQAGACMAGPPLVCLVIDECNDPGPCDPSTGLCGTSPKADGTPCTGGTCQAGVCVSATGAGGAGGMGGAGGTGGTGGAGGMGGTGGENSSSVTGSGGMGDAGGRASGGGGADGDTSGESGAGGNTTSAGGNTTSAGDGGVGSGGMNGDAGDAGGCGCRTAGAPPDDVPPWGTIAWATLIAAAWRRRN